MSEVKASELLQRIVACTTRPNPQDQSRIDVAKGQHRAFVQTIKDAEAFLDRQRLGLTPPNPADAVYGALRARVEALPKGAQAMVDYRGAPDLLLDWLIAETRRHK